MLICEWNWALHGGRAWSAISSARYSCWPLPQCPTSPGCRQPWIARTPWISWAGGIFGAIFIGTAIFMVPRLGAATVLALIVVGQMIGSLAFDHFGLFGVPQHAANPVRLAGAAFLVLGVTLVRF
jgi:uncharacterized membrane protein YdcZ (DUF606 family)